ncbi:toprim domain-containing protein [Mesorhizobium captivum]|uniref:toprim domain-containing protein n=1 Tax=Mesorhizobium captivum TaxID=3072319 RepID=UPI002A240D9A|nr:toprim domain-containing protein [Mesorhizobium sp. VK3C]MDX8450700.1 toprim domain-containing protein [Mesorhizobium sp. VK3C]
MTVDYAALSRLLGTRDCADAPCPACSPLRKPANRRKPVLRLWRIVERLISYHCVHCEISGCVWESGKPGAISPENLNEARRQREALQAEAVAASRELARSIYARRRPVEDSLGEVYFRQHRKITCRLPATMGFLPGDGRYPPAVVMPFGPAHEVEPGLLAIRPEAIMAVHLTRLTSGGEKLAVNAKVMIGHGAQGFPLVVAPPNDLLGLAITEGVEDALSVHEATGLGAWAAGSASRLPALADQVPGHVDCVTVLADDDAAGHRHAPALVERLIQRGIHAEISILGTEAV